MSRTSLGEGSEESILALIQAIAPELANDSRGQLTSDEVANRLTDKLAEIVGQESMGDEKRNERGELINEEGLPIVEISECVDPTDLRTSTSKPTPVTVEPLIPLAGLSDEARARLRAKRNQILDLLEKEEKETELAQRRREAEEQESNAQKRREEAAKEKEKLQETRELQKKMGRALLLNVSRAKEKERQEQEAQRLQDEVADLDRKRSPTVKKKTVAFAERTEQIDRSETESESVNSAEWGDLTPGRLTRRKRPDLVSQALLDQHPMKMNVVERTPTEKTSKPTRRGLDSDDDSEPDFLPGSSESEEEPTLETDEIDFDAAQHQREIALEYYTKRDTVGKAAAQVIAGHSPEVGIHSTSKPAIFNFKANRLASAYNGSTSSSSQSQSTSPGDSVLPNPSAQKIRRSIRTGKLDTDGNLVGGEADSGSENETEGLQEMLELLQKGEIYNIGPNGEYIHTIPPTGQGNSASSSRPIASSPHLDSSLPPPSMRSKTSKFKASRGSAGRPTPAYIPMPEPDLSASESVSSSTTPISYETRSSPKLDTPTTTAITPTVGERKPHLQASSSSNASQMQSPRPITATSNQVPSFPMIIESPSFPALSGSQSTSPILRDSLSFQKQRPSRPDRPPMVLSIGIPKAEAQQPSVRTNTNETPPFLVPSRPDQPVAIVSSTINQEPATGQNATQISTGQEQKAKKISRFKAERTS